MKMYGIIGYPLNHSFSKKYFTQKFQQEAISDCFYNNYPLATIGALKALLIDNPYIAGLNVTIPHKQKVLELLDDSTKIPVGLNACNCIKINKGKLIGFNTDIIGFENSLTPLLITSHKKALILGNGGAAAAVKYVLRKLNIGYNIVSRVKQDPTNFIYSDLNKEIIDQHTLIINTTPLGTAPVINACPDLPYQYLHSGHLLYDLIYNPDKTLFLQKGELQRATIKNGYEMLLIQAAESWRIWNED